MCVFPQRIRVAVLLSLLVVSCPLGQAQQCSRRLPALTGGCLWATESPSILSFPHSTYSLLRVLSCLMTFSSRPGVPRGWGGGVVPLFTVAPHGGQCLGPGRHSIDTAGMEKRFPPRRPIGTSQRKMFKGEQPPLICVFPHRGWLCSLGLILLEDDGSLSLASSPPSCHPIQVAECIPSSPSHERVCSGRLQEDRMTL